MVSGELEGQQAPSAVTTLTDHVIIHKLRYLQQWQTNIEEPGGKLTYTTPQWVLSVKQQSWHIPV